MEDTELRTWRDDEPLMFHRLVYLVDGDEVTVGRPDTDSYAIFPPDGAELVRRLEAGATPLDAGQWYKDAYGVSADIDHVLSALDELGFIRISDEAQPAPTPIRWQRLGKALFSRPALLAYGVVVCWAVVAMARTPELAPSYRNLFFTEYFTIIELVLFVAAIPQLALHESFHALAGRRLGVRSRLRFGRRLYFLVLETSLDGLVAVPRRKRYLPILAGMLADVIALAVLVIAADITRQPGGGLSYFGRICLAVSYATALRLIWQFFFYLRTDLYVLITTILGCVDLHTTAKRMLGNRVRRLLRRRGLHDESEWHPVDRRIARWYSWLIVAGYSASLSTFVIAVGPAAYRMFSGALGRFAGGSGATTWDLLDSAVFIVVTLTPLAVAGWLAVRERRHRSRRRRLDHVIT